MWYIIWGQTSDSINEATDFINWYTKEYDGKEIITDFDGMIPRLKAAIPLSMNPLEANKTEVKKLITNCDAWIKRSIIK